MRAFSQEDTDAFLARALLAPSDWPQGAEPERVVARALYHGVAGCLADRVTGWHPEAAEPLRRAALAQAMWEMRHRLILDGLLRALDAAGVRVLLLKGSALAYDLYDPPSARARGDSDLLISLSDLSAARETLAAQGFVHFYENPTADEAARLQEAWERRTSDGLVHEVDLHWQAVNAPALAHLMPFEAAWKRALSLPRLGPTARGLARDQALLLACAHRAQHRVNPYTVDGITYYGGDRLIWLRDIDLLVRALDGAEWASLVEEALESGLAPVALDSLRTATAFLGTPLPETAIARLVAAPDTGPVARYLLKSDQTERAWRNLRSTPGLRAKAAFLWGQLFPSAAFMRLKYPDRATKPLPLLHLRRIAEFLRSRPRGGSR